MKRKAFIAGNWKMNTTVGEATALARAIVDGLIEVNPHDVDIAVCPPYTNLAAVGEIIRGSFVALGAQDVHWEEKGAFTGKVSCAMLKALGVEFVIVGHSEQRQYFHESDETVNKKIRAVLAADLKPIVCVGETLQERKANQLKQVVETQVRGAFDQLSASQVAECTIAYEPVWAIGTGEVATPQQADEAHRIIRECVAGLYANDISQSLRIQYGGSMKPDNAKELLALDNVDGGLIGGAALKAPDFLGIAKSAPKL